MTRLDSDLHIIIWDLLETYNLVSKDRVRTSLRSVMHDKLVEAFDPDDLYNRSSLAIKKNELVLTLLVSLDDTDDTEYDAPDVEWTINAKTGKCHSVEGNF